MCNAFHCLTSSRKQFFIIDVHLVFDVCTKKSQSQSETVASLHLQKWLRTQDLARLSELSRTHNPSASSHESDPYNLNQLRSMVMLLFVLRLFCYVTYLLARRLTT